MTTMPKNYLLSSSEASEELNEYEITNYFNRLQMSHSFLVLEVNETYNSQRGWKVKRIN